MSPLLSPTALAGDRYSRCLLLRETIVNRTYGTHKKTTRYIFTNFYYQHLVLFTMLPRISFRRVLGERVRRARLGEGVACSRFTRWSHVAVRECVDATGMILSGAFRIISRGGAP